MLLDPLPLSQTVTLSRTPFPLERDVLYGRPQSTRGHPFMMSKRRGSDSGGCLRTGEGVSAMWTFKQKIIARLRHPVFFSCKEVGVFGPAFRLSTN